MIVRSNEFVVEQASCLGIDLFTRLNELSAHVIHTLVRKLQASTRAICLTVPDLYSSSIIIMAGVQMTGSDLTAK